MAASTSLFLTEAFQNINFLSSQKGALLFEENNDSHQGLCACFVHRRHLIDRERMCAKVFTHFAAKNKGTIFV